MSENISKREHLSGGEDIGVSGNISAAGENEYRTGDMPAIERTLGRKFFIGWITMAVAGLAGVIWFRKKREQPVRPAAEKLTLLTQDGRLVQVDVSAVQEQKKRKVTNEELLTWVKPRP